MLHGRIFTPPPCSAYLDYSREALPYVPASALSVVSAVRLLCLCPESAPVVGFGFRAWAVPGGRPTTAPGLLALRISCIRVVDVASHSASQEWNLSLRDGFSAASGSSFFCQRHVTRRHRFSTVLMLSDVGHRRSGFPRSCLCDAVMISIAVLAR